MVFKQFLINWVTEIAEPTQESESEVAQSCPTLRPYGQQPTRLLCPQDSPGKNTRVGCHFLLQKFP